MKSGHKTTEFWLSLIAQALPILVITGVLSPEEADAVQNTTKEAITAGVAFGGALIALVTYIHGRAKIKVAELEAKK